MKYIYFIITALLLQSCYTLKPDSRYLSEKDKNDKQEISSPVFVKKRNPIGVTFNIVTPLAAGAAMYEFVDPVVKYQDGAETKGFKPANAAIGIIGMMAINKIIDYSMGYNKTVNPTDKSIQKWMNKTNLSKNYSYIYNNSNQLMIIPKSKENYYVVHNFQDVNNFKNFFPNSINYENIINQAANKLNRQELKELITSNPNSSNLQLAKDNYIKQSKNTRELFESFELFPNSTLNKESEAFSRVQDDKDAILFNRFFPNNPKIEQVYKIGLSKIVVSEYPSYISNFKTVSPSLLEKSKQDFVNSCSSVSQCKDYVNIYPDYYDLGATKAKSKLNNYSDYENFLQYFNKSQLYNDVNNSYKSVLFNKMNSLNDELGLYNFHLELKNYNSDNAQFYSSLAYGKFNYINSLKVDEYNDAVDYNNDNALVKVIFKMKNNKPAIAIAEDVENYMRRRKSSTGIKTVIINITMDNENNFTNVMKPKTHKEMCVINGSWYRMGTTKDGAMWNHNTGFDKFQTDIKSFLNDRGAELLHCDYLGSYLDDERKREETRLYQQRYKQEQCEKCTVDWEKLKRPKTEELFWQEHIVYGKIVMKNRDEYEWNYSSSGGFYVESGLFSMDKYPDFDSMIQALQDKCRTKFCN